MLVAVFFVRAAKPPRSGITQEHGLHRSSCPRFIGVLAEQALNPYKTSRV